MIQASTNRGTTVFKNQAYMKPTFIRKPDSSRFKNVWN